MILLDGAFGTSLWKKAGERGIEKVPTWRYNIEHPELIRELVSEYKEAGSEIIQANTFSANCFSLKGTGYEVSEVIKAGVRCTKEALSGTGVKTFLSCGPLPVMIEPYGDTEESEAADCYREIFEAAVTEAPDIITLETFMDLNMLRIALCEAKKTGLPVFCTMTFEKSLRTVMGNTIEDICRVLSDGGADAVGMNCSLGPDEAFPVIKRFSECTSLPLIYKPNAGLPGDSSFDKKGFADSVMPAVQYVSYLGGCCGTDPAYIKELAARCRH